MRNILNIHLCVSNNIKWALIQLHSILSISYYLSGPFHRILGGWFLNSSNKRSRVKLLHFTEFMPGRFPTSDVVYLVKIREKLFLWRKRVNQTLTTTRRGDWPLENDGMLSTWDESGSFASWNRSDVRPLCSTSRSCPSFETRNSNSLNPV